MSVFMFITIALLCVLKSGGVRPPTLFFFEIVLASWGSLRFPVNFRGDSSGFAQVLLDFCRGCFESVAPFGR